MLKKILLFLLLPSAFIMLVLWLLTYYSRPDVSQLQDYFESHPQTFRQLALKACDSQQRHGPRFYVYPPAVYPSSGPAEPRSAPDLALDQALAGLLSDGFIEFVSLEGSGCTAHAIVWDSTFYGEGQTMGYVYQPVKTFDYIAEKHAKGQRNYQSELTFTLPLTDGWYIYYHNVP